MPENQERHYDITKLNKLFAVAAFVLLVTLIGMFANDYSREWKGFQKDFRHLEIEKTRDKLKEEDKKLYAQPDYMDAVKKMADAQFVQGDKQKDIDSVQAQIDKIRAKYDLADQRRRFAKAELDAVKYDYETALHGNSPNVKSVGAKMEHLKDEMSRLQTDLEVLKKDLDAKNSVLEGYEHEVKDLDKKSKAAAKQVDLLEKKLRKIDPDRMSSANKFADSFRDLPIIDLANPNYKIKQIVLRDITDNVNFMRVPRVERCITCHLGIDNPDFKDAPQPFRTHPRLDLFVGPKSAHSMEEFGCTTCHGGRGRGTDFRTTAHTPSSEQQKEEWIKKYNWKEFKLWENPMLPKQYVEAGCFKCHSNETPLKGADKLNLGLQIVERAGCYNCHLITRYKDWPKPGPDLTKLSSKTKKEWVYRWIENPKSFRHNTWMPTFFNQSNTSDPESVKRTQQEIHAIVAYLFKNSQDYKMDSLPSGGNAKHGEELVASIGCFACHDIAKEPSKEKRDAQHLRREQGPNLIGLGTKTSAQWIYNWIKDPQRYHPGTKMPNLRLSDEEAADITAFLSADKQADFMKGELPAIDEVVVTQITQDFLKKTMTAEEVKAKLAEMKLADKLEFSGKKLIGHYGCFACHIISGFENEKPIGTELTEEGSKSIHNLDFGFVNIEDSNHAFFMQKLMNPRIFDQGKVKAPDEKLKMPNFNFTDDEAEAVVTAILSFVKEKPQSTKLRPRTPETAYIEEGQKLVRQLNCQGCHIIEGEGGAIQPKIQEWIMKYKDKTEGEAQPLVKSSSPPNLIGEGKKVQPDWLYGFLHQPTTIRPWLKVRMPTYKLSATQLNTLIKYFNALDHEEFPFPETEDVTMSPEEHAAAEKLFSKDYFGCASCHIVGDKMPEGSAESWAPNFALAQKRLKPKWIIQWLNNPQDLLPGTKMPTYFDPKMFDQSGPDDILGGDEHLQIKVLRDYVMSIASMPSSHETAVIPKKEEPAAVPESPAAPQAKPTDSVTAPAPIDQPAKAASDAATAPAPTQQPPALKPAQP